jgi:hypothetical protein
MKKLIAISLIIVGLAACGKKEDYDAKKYQSNPANSGSQSIPETKIISYHGGNSLVIGRYVDEEYGNVCYVYDHSISCQPLKK